MKKRIIVSLLITICSIAFSQSVKVELKNIDGMYQIYRDGKPYYIHGAGGQGT